jgi:Flp pilus assembly CpaF family ATPase
MPRDKSNRIVQPSGRRVDREQQVVDRKIVRYPRNNYVKPPRSTYGQILARHKAERAKHLAPVS